MPDTIQFGNGRQIINSYDAGGHKLTTQYYTPIGTVIVTQGNIHGSYTTANSVLLLDDYCGSYLYENGTSASNHPLTKILTPEGYIDMSTSGYPYCYFKQDHLGSNREVTSYAGTTGTVVQQTEYYPSGTAYVEGTGAGIQPFKFTGKELILMHGLNWQDFGARWLDNVRMQWTTMDPLCEKYYAISPYTYCSDDPAKNIDPDGRDIYIINNNGVLEKAREVMLQTESGKQLWDKYAKSKTDDIYLTAQRQQGDQYAETLYKVNSLGMIKNNKLSVNISKTRQEDFSSLNNLDVSKSKGKTISLISFNEESTSKASTMRNAKTYFHEIKAHIDLATGGTTKADMEKEHQRLGVGYRTDKTGTYEIIKPNSPMDIYVHELETIMLIEKTKFKPPMP